MMSSNNNDDLYFYLTQNDKFKISDQFMINCIKKSYNELFIYAYKKIYPTNYIVLIDYIYSKNNTELFSFILNYEKDIKFKYIVDNMLNYDNKFNIVSLLLNEYFDKLDKNSSFIKLCLINNIEDTVIKHLIDSGFKINIDDIKYCAENENIVLVEHLSKKYNSI